jgi:hypothetical protein
MGWEDYEAGKQNYTAPVNIGAPGWMDFQQGQRDEAQRIQDSYRPLPGAGSVGPAAPSGPRLKSLIIASLLAFLFGPLGLLYATKRGAVALVCLWFVAPAALVAFDMYGSSQAEVAETYELLIRTLAPVVWTASIVVAAFATRRYNRRIRKTA